MSKTFRFRSNIEFQAETVDDAFLKLSEHFRNLHDGKDSSLGQTGMMDIRPLGDDTETPLKPEKFGGEMDNQIKDRLIAAYEMWLQDDSPDQEWFRWIFGCFDRMKELYPDEMKKAYQTAERMREQKRRSIEHSNPGAGAITP